MSLVSQTELVDLSAVLRLVSERARLLTGATGVAIALPHKQSMICRASIGVNAPSLGSRLDMTSGFSAECVRTGKALCCYDSETDPRVDPVSCRRLGIRSILALPIRLDHQTLGLLEVFSPLPYAFEDRHVAPLAGLVQRALLTNPSLLLPAPKLVTEAKPESKDFVDRVAELPTPKPSFTRNSLPAQFWSDVFVTAPVPWNRFAQSLALHVVMVALLAILPRLVPSRPYAVRPALTQSDLLYYSPAEYYARGDEKVVAKSVNRRRFESPAQRVLRVASEQRSSAPIAAPDIKLKGNIRVLSLMALSPASPAIPGSAVVRSQFTTPTAAVSVVPPPVDASAAGRPRALGGQSAAGLASVIPPPPEIRAAGSRRAVGGGLGSVIAPPPDISAPGRTRGVGGQFAAATGLGTVIPPPPDATAAGRSRGVGGQFATATGLGGVVPPPPEVAGAGGARGVGGQFGTGPGSVIAPPPEVAGVGGSRVVAGQSGNVVGPPPSVRGSFRHGPNMSIGQMEVVGPAPEISGQGNSNLGTAQGSLGNEMMSVVAPPPSVQGVGSTRGQNGGATPGGVSSVIPPPQVAAGGNSRASAQGSTAMAVVPAPPSTTGAGNSASVNPARAAMPGDVPSSSRPAIPDITAEERTSRGSQQVSVTPISPEVALASSSYFASSEIFIAEERTGPQRSRYIKLVYEYLPYQKRLSEYGPNYPEVDKLRVTRDAACDEDLFEEAFSGKTGEQSGRSTLVSQYLAQQQTLVCFRTTADDYRRALEHRRKGRTTAR